MDQSTMWDAVHAERRSLARDLDGLSADQWEAPSLCPGWSVHDVLAHLIGSATNTVGVRPADGRRAARLRPYERPGGGAAPSG